MKRGRRLASCAEPQTDFGRTIAPHGRVDRVRSLRPSSGPLQRKRTNQWIGWSISAMAASNMTPRCFRKRLSLQRLWRRRTAHPNVTTKATAPVLEHFLITLHFPLCTFHFELLTYFELLTCPSWSIASSTSPRRFSTYATARSCLADSRSLAAGVAAFDMASSKSFRRTEIARS